MVSRLFFLSVIILSTAITHTQGANVLAREDRRVVYPADGEFAAHIGMVAQVVHGTSLQRCSGMLVAPRVVLTAGHCITLTNGRFDAERTPLRFLAGLRDNNLPADTTARQVVDARFGNQTVPGHLYDNDWGFLILEAGLPHVRYENLQYPPVRTIAENEFAEYQLEVVGFSGDRFNGTSASTHRDCTIVGRFARRGMKVDCDFNPGASGGPVIGRKNGQPTAIVGVITAHLLPQLANLLASMRGVDNVPLENWVNGAASFTEELRRLERVYTNWE